MVGNKGLFFVGPEVSLHAAKWRVKYRDAQWLAVSGSVPMNDSVEAIGNQLFTLLPNFSVLYSQLALHYDNIYYY